MGKIPITRVGADLLRAELHRLKTVDRPAVITAIAEARAHGDISENAEYDAAREKQGFIEGRILELEAKLVDVARTLAGLGFTLVATKGTAAALEAGGLTVQRVNKVMEGRPNVVDMIRNKEVSLIINTVEEDRRSVRDSWSIRNSALQGRVTYYTTVSGARAACVGMQHIEELRPYDLQGLHATLP